MAEPRGGGQNRRLQVFGIWAEIVAAAAVVISLIFVGIQVRQTAEETALNTEATRAAAYAQSVTGLNQWRQIIAGDLQLATLWDSYIADDREILEPGDEMRLQMLLVILWANYENAYYANQYGLLGASEWARHEAQICIRYHDDSDRWTRSGQENGPLPIRTLVSEEFVVYVESTCG